MSEEQIRNRNNSMQPIPGLRDDYYRNAPTPAVFNHEYSNNCLFHNKDQQYNVTSNGLSKLKLEWIGLSKSQLI